MWRMWHCTSWNIWWQSNLKKKNTKKPKPVLVCRLLEAFKAAINHGFPFQWSMWVTVCASRALIKSQDAWGWCSLCKAYLILSANQAIFKELFENYKSWKITRYRDNYFYFEKSAEKIKITLRLKCSVPAFTVSLVSRSTVGDGRAKINLER